MQLAIPPLITQQRCSINRQMNSTHKYGQLIILLSLWLCACQTKPTYYQTVKPILEHHCTDCHHAGGPAHFSLSQYQEVLKQKDKIKFVINNKQMPPWPADNSFSHFADEKGMSAAEIELVNDWLAAGCPKGKVEADIAVVTDKEQHEKPDLVLHFPNSIFIKGNNTDHFFVARIPYELVADTFLRAIEIMPGNRRLLHHLNLHLVMYDEGKKLKPLTRQWLFAKSDTLDDSQLIHQKLDLLNDDGSYPTLVKSVANYLPGTQFQFYPEEIGGWRMKRKGMLYLQDIHFGPTATDDYDSTVIKIYFTKNKPNRPIKEFILGTLGVSPVVPPLSISPNTVRTFYSSALMSEDVSLLSITPHMHLLGKRFYAIAITPALDTIPLIKINQWDFNWQYTYNFLKPVCLPRGSVVYAEGEYDNTTANKNNPFFPPRTISDKTGSMKTTDEMFQFIVSYLAYRQNDENLLLSK